MLKTNFVVPDFVCVNPFTVPSISLSDSAKERSRALCSAVKRLKEERSINDGVEQNDLRWDFDFDVDVMITGAGTLQTFDSFTNQTETLVRLGSRWNLNRSDWN